MYAQCNVHYCKILVQIFAFAMNVPIISNMEMRQYQLRTLNCFQVPNMNKSFKDQYINQRNIGLKLQKTWFGLKSGTKYLTIQPRPLRNGSLEAASAFVLMPLTGTWMKAAEARRLWFGIVLSQEANLKLRTQS